MKSEDIVEINDGYVEVIPPKPEDYEFIRLMNKIFIEYVGGDKKKFLALTKEEQKMLMDKSINTARELGIYIPEKYLNINFATD